MRIKVDFDVCVSTAACMQACPFIIPKYDYENFAPKIHKCTFCADRLEVGLAPACATVCPTDAISFGDRDDMVAEAKRRIATAPGTYIPEIYGLDEVGGTSVLHLSSVPFAQIGYITGLPKTPMPDLTHRWLRLTAPVFALLYGVFGALNWIVRRRMRRSLRWIVRRLLQRIVRRRLRRRLRHENGQQVVRRRQRALRQPDVRPLHYWPPLA